MHFHFTWCTGTCNLLYWNMCSLVYFHYMYMYFSPKLWKASIWSKETCVNELENCAYQRAGHLCIPWQPYLHSSFTKGLSLIRAAYWLTGSTTAWVLHNPFVCLSLWCTHLVHWGVTSVHYDRDMYLIRQKFYFL